MNKSISWYKRIDKLIFGLSFGILTAFVIWALLIGEKLDSIMSNALSFCTHKFGWLYLIVAFVVVLVIFYLMFSKYGDIKLGDDDEKPEYSNFGWWAMLLGIGYGVGLTYWGVAEPLSFFNSPPLGLEPQSVEAAEVALQYTFFHWGWVPWAIYSFMGITYGYYIFRKKYVPKYSMGLIPIMSNYGGIWTRLLETLFLISMAGGIITSLGLGVMQFAAGLEQVLGIPATTLNYVIIGCICIAIFTASCLSGISKGIQWLSVINVRLCIGVMFFMLLVGPTFFNLDIGVQAFGDYCTNFVKMCFRTDAIGQGGFPQGWTIFYWAWWLACCPACGMFIGMISRGRTIRQVLIGSMVVMPIFTWLWFATFGGSALHLEMFSNAGLSNILAENGTSGVLFNFLQHFPLYRIVSFLYLVLIIIFLSTSCDSISFTCAQVTTKEKYNPLDPPKAIRGIWAIGMGVAAIVLIIGGKGISGLQLSSVIVSLPITITMVFIIIGFFKSLKQDPKFNTNIEVRQKTNVETNISNNVEL